MDFNDVRKVDDSFRGDKSEDAQSFLQSSYLAPALSPPHSLAIKDPSLPHS
jgi:hypothetical protein